MRLSMVTGTTQLNQCNLHSVHVIIAKCLSEDSGLAALTIVEKL
jgi:hypothetical protein